MFESLENTAVAIWVGESLWGYPVLLALHVVGLAIVVGIFVMRDLRLLGQFDGISYESLERLRRLGWTGFVINAISGCFLFSSQAVHFSTSTPFLLKISMIFLAAIAAAVIQNRMHAGAAGWDRAGRVPGTVRGLAALSIVLWTGAIVAGRLTAYL